MYYRVHQTRTPKIVDANKEWYDDFMKGLFLRMFARRKVKKAINNLRGGGRKKYISGYAER